MKYFGYKGKILMINLTTKKTSILEITDEFARKYLGGNGFSARLLFDMIDPRIDAFDPTNVISIMTGPFQGTYMPTSGKYHVASKSPLTNGFFDSISGGYMGAEIKYAGYDGILITGRAEKPTYIFIDDDKIEFRSAERLWGRLTSETQEMIKEEIGDPTISVSAIGPAGENLVRYACIITEYRAAGRGGLGAVMGSKRLKAIAVRGSGTNEVADPEGLENWLKWYNEESKKVPGISSVLPTYGTPSLVSSINNIFGAMGTRNHQTEYFEGWEGLCGETLKKKYWDKDTACPACPIACSKIFSVKEGKWKGAISEGPDYETIYSFGSMCGISDVGAVIKADNLCDEYGMDTISCGVTISFLMECYEKGLIDKNFTGGIELKFGNDDAMVDLVEKTAKRIGIGDLIAEGSLRAARIIGKGSERFAIQVKGLEIPGHSARALRGMALGYAVASRGGSHHDPRPTGEYAGASDRKAVEGKAAWVIGTMQFTTIGDSMIICHFLERLLGFTLNPKHAEMINIVTGFNYKFEELVEVAERILDLERAFNVRTGIRRKDDTLPRRFLEEPIPEGPSKGMYTDEQTLNKMLDDFYTLKGWDKRTGIPTKEKLIKIGLEDVAKELEKL
ncbi:MAG: aldehyde ferredoxin oxidoreductase [Candidatus Methanomethylicota archaeon]|jgi:aldehyde:ferredoxin oxidoreductase|uniref:Aldehyde ferredoxin oxidoreductase n=1 Tax=Thermoproteota archaeon TaxID=2056631 RepID=A0A520KFN0_9CREN|nr:MAG: aldehyde ferredoxin oxidoreductase [Candidatus Verstraetearchaeota archaeon]TDA37774.1 MAG: aldehyde ferredoxin oxidoreductase [Candidatus Verstraetearchaeota archaeon]